MDLAKAHNDMLLVMLEGFAAGIAKSKGEEEAGKIQQLNQRIYSSSLEGACHVCSEACLCGEEEF